MAYNKKARYFSQLTVKEIKEWSNAVGPIKWHHYLFFTAYILFMLWCSFPVFK